MVMILLSTIIMIAIIFFAGICIEKLFKQQFRFSRVMMTGFLALLAAFQIIAYPMIRLNTSFSLLFWVFTCILLLCVVFAILLLFQTTTRKTIIQHATILRESILKEIPLLCITIGVLAFALFVSCAFNYETSDDSYYLAKSIGNLILVGLEWRRTNRYVFSGRCFHLRMLESVLVLSVRNAPNCFYPKHVCFCCTHCFLVCVIPCVSERCQE